MPGIAADSIAPIQASLIAQGGEPATPLAIGDLMSGFKSGFITVDDLQRRASEEMTRNDQQKTTFQANELKRRLMPGEAENELAAQGLQKARTQAAIELFPGQAELARQKQAADLHAADIAAGLTSPDDETVKRATALQKRDKWIAATGSPPPKELTVPVPPEEQKPVPTYDDWVDAQYGKEIQAQVDKFGGISQKDAAKRAKEYVDSIGPEDDEKTNAFRAAVQRDQNDKLKAMEAARAEYARTLAMKKYADLNTKEAYHQAVVEATKENTERVVKAGTPEYDAEFQRRLKAMELAGLIQTAKVTALPKVLEEQAKYASEAPAREAAAAEKRETRVFSTADAYEASTPIKNLRTVETSYLKLKEMLDPTKEPTPQKDQAAIFQWMKILDPGSTVREGEYKSAEKTRGILESATMLWKKAARGEILTPEQRRNFLAASEPIFRAQVEGTAPLIQRNLDNEKLLGTPGRIVPAKDAELLKAVEKDRSLSAGAVATSASVKAPPLGSRLIRPTEGPNAGKLLRWVGPGATDYVQVAQ